MTPNLAIAIFVPSDINTDAWIATRTSKWQNNSIMSYTVSGSAQFLFRRCYHGYEGNALNAVDIDIVIYCPKCRDHTTSPARQWGTSCFKNKPKSCTGHVAMRIQETSTILLLGNRTSWTSSRTYDFHVQVGLFSSSLVSGLHICTLL